MTKKYTVASLFAGVGGIDFGFDNAGFETIWANEIDPYCKDIYNTNHPHSKLVIDDIHNIKAHDIPDVDILVGGFPCQPFSVAGYRKGFEDDRGNLFFEIIRILEELKNEKRMPRIVFLENVKNLFTHENGKTYSFMKESLENLGYKVTEKILNSYQYGNVPQNRERLYMIGFFSQIDYDNFRWIEKIPLTNTLDKVISFGIDVENNYYYTEEHKPYSIMKSEVTKRNTIYQFRRTYMRENKSNISPTLTANMGMGGHNVPIILDYKNRIRKLTPRETFLLQGFSQDFILPDKIAKSRLYKMAGNSVTIGVIERIAKNIKASLDKNGQFEKTNKL